MPFNYDKIKNTADKLIVNFGQSVLITNKTSGTYDPSTRKLTETTTTQNGTGAIFDRGSSEIDGTTILMGDRRMLLSAVGITKPKINDTIIVDSTNYTIKEPLIEINPAGTVIMYELNLRV